MSKEICLCYVNNRANKISVEISECLVTLTLADIDPYNLVIKCELFVDLQVLYPFSCKLHVGLE